VERQGYGWEADISLSVARSGDYEAILLIGGRAPEYVRNNAELLDMVRKFDAENKWIFAICHGIQILVAAGLAHGRRVTCYEHVKYEVQQAGGTWVAEQAVQDGHMITAQTWQSHPEFYKAIFSVL